MLEMWTPWGMRVEGDGSPKHVEHEAHEVYSAMVLDLLKQVAPSLLEAIERSGSRVVVGPSRFFVVTPDEVYHLVPELSQLLNLTPWQEPGELMH